LKLTLNEFLKVVNSLSTRVEGLEKLSKQEGQATSSKKSKVVEEEEKVSKSNKKDNKKS